MSPTKLMFIGGGKMAEAIIGGLHKHSEFQISVVDPHEKQRQALQESFQVRTFESVQHAEDAIATSDLLVLAVKPQQTKAVFQELGGSLSHGKTSLTAVSIVAGLPLKQLQDGLGIERVCRSMPNTPAMVSKGMTVWTATNEVDHETRNLVKQFFASCGEEEFVADETVLDMATALSGSGPAYFFLTMESMVDAGVHLGLPRDLATRLVKQTMSGTATLAIESNDPIPVLRSNITSPGGTTAAAMYMAERGGFRTVLSDATWAAYRRSLELGKKDNDVGPIVNR